MGIDLCKFWQNSDNVLKICLKCENVMFQIIPFYTLISPILILFIIKWSQQLKAAKLRRLMKPNGNENDAYFQTYTQMWNNNMAL